MKLIYRLGIDGYIADNQFRKRDPRFAESETFKTAKAQRRKERGGQVAQRFTPTEFDYDSLTETCRCPAGQPMWKRLSTVEPVFGNLESSKGLNRFTLRGKSKVNAQWLMYCMVHNLEKIVTQGQQRH